MKDRARTQNVRPSMRDIAKVAGVCPMTVSLSLRGSPSISEPTRKRVCALAAEMGYQPDPKVQQLMEYLRRGRKRQLNGALVVALCQRFVPLRHGYPEEILEGARARASDLGYIFDHIWLDEANFKGERLRRILSSRGAECLLLLPMMDVLDLSELVVWDRYTVISTSATVVAPRFHTVLPDQFSNTMVLCDAFHKARFGKVGLVVSESYLFRVNKRAAAAISWHHTETGLDCPPTLTFKDYELKRADLLQWLEDYRPGAIITESAFFARLISGFLADTDFAQMPIGCLSLLQTASGFSGILENPRAVGAAAIELLDRMYRVAEKGIPDNPILTMVGGQYIRGR